MNLLQSLIGQPVAGAPSSLFPLGISIVGPTNGAQFTALGRVDIIASAWDLDDFVTRVDFHATGTQVGTNVLIATLTNSLPGTNSYSVTWSNVLLGSYTLNAVATDNLGVSSTSAPVSV